MKKRLFAGCLCIFFAFFLSLSGFIYLNAECKKLIEQTENVLSASDETVLLMEVDRLINRWNACRTIFGALLKHSDADELTRVFLLLGRDAASKNTLDTSIRLKELNALLQVILYGEKPDFENIL